MTREECHAACVDLLGVPANEVECVEVSDPYADSYERPLCCCKILRYGKMTPWVSARTWEGLLVAVERGKVVACGGR